MNLYVNVDIYTTKWLSDFPVWLTSLKKNAVHFKQLSLDSCLKSRTDYLAVDETRALPLAAMHPALSSPSQREAKSLSSFLKSAKISKAVVN